MKGDKVQNKDERRNKRRVASLLFRARTMFRPFSHALYNTLSGPVVYLVSKTITFYFNTVKVITVFNGQLFSKKKKKKKTLSMPKSTNYIVFVINVKI